MTKIILTGPLPTAEETADRLGLTDQERVSVNKILRTRRKGQPRVQLLPVGAKLGAQKSEGSHHARPGARKAAAV